MNFKFLLLCILGVFMLNGHLFAQTEDAEDNAAYFDDGTRGRVKNVIKTGLFSVATGDFYIGYERAFGNRFALEVGAGYILPYYWGDLSQLLTLAEEPGEVENGYSLRLHPKVYWHNQAPVGYQVGGLYRRQHFNLIDGKATFHDFLMMGGFQAKFGNTFIMTYDGGYGARISFKEGESSGEPVEYIFHIDIGLGFIF